MNYTKPELAVLGKAVRVIEGVITKTPLGQLDASMLRHPPAYDLDE
jgi:hypothetical protein